MKFKIIKSRKTSEEEHIENILNFYIMDELLKFADGHVVHAHNSGHLYLDGKPALAYNPGYFSISFHIDRVDYGFAEEIVKKIKQKYKRIGYVELGKIHGNVTSECSELGFYSFAVALHDVEENPDYVPLGKNGKQIGSDWMMRIIDPELNSDLGVSVEDE